MTTAANTATVRAVKRQLRTLGKRRQVLLTSVGEIDGRIKELAAEADRLEVSRSEIARLADINRNTLYLWLGEL